MVLRLCSRCRLLSLCSPTMSSQHRYFLCSPTISSWFVKDQKTKNKRSPSDFLKSVLGRPAIVKLNSGIEYRGVLACLDGYLNIAMEQTQEYGLDGQLKATYGDCFIRGNNVLHISSQAKRKTGLWRMDLGTSSVKNSRQWFSLRFRINRQELSVPTLCDKISPSIVTNFDLCLSLLSCKSCVSQSQTRLTAVWSDRINGLWSPSSAAFCSFFTEKHW